MNFDNKFLNATLLLLDDQLRDLETWSVFNRDQALEEILAIKIKIEALKIQLHNLEEAESVMWEANL